MKLMKKVTSIFLVFILFINMMPIVQAEKPETVTETGPVTLTGTNGFGSLLTEDIESEKNEAGGEYLGGYSIVGMTITNAIATVEYSTLEEAIMIVALYSEKGQQMLLSAKTTVDPDESTVDVALVGEMPEYFLASAYLVDTYDYSPLCVSYETPMYTREMQELLDSTVTDYNADRVLNLDANQTTNFAVFADTTKVVKSTAGVNMVVSANDETATYVIKNADENFTSLKSGDVVAYAYGENDILLAKVGIITIDGSTVTIIGEDLELEEVFSHVKIEVTGNTTDIEVDPSEEEGVIYEGLVQAKTRTPFVRAFEGESSTSDTLSYKLEKKFGSATKLTGQLGINIKIKFSYYVSTKRQYVDYKMDIGLQAKVTLTGKAEGDIPLGKFTVPFYGVDLVFQPKFQVKVKGEVDFTVFVGVTQGMSFENGKGIRSLGTKPKVEAEFKIKASVFVGIDLNPQVKVLKGAAIEAKLEVPVGFELEGELKGQMHEKPDSNAASIHGCYNCMDMELKFIIEFEATIKFLKSKKLTYKSKNRAIEAKIGDLYWSIDNNKFGWGTCPYKSYRVTVYVRDQDKNPLKDSEITATKSGTNKETTLGGTNSKGVVVAYVEGGTHTFISKLNGEKKSQKLKITEARKIYFDWTIPEEEPAPVLPEEEEEFIDYGEVIAYGNCGAEGDNVTWTLNKGGTLIISGTGKMEDYIGDWMEETNAPWYALRSQIVNVFILPDVTSIGDSAFGYCSNLNSITIPGSVSSIGEAAFMGCSSLTGVTIPNSITSICDYTFASCSSLTSIAIPNSVTSIGYSVFLGCSKLTEIVIPSSVEKIGGFSFAECSNLTSVVLPDGLTTIGESMFWWCTNLKSITIPSSVNSIGSAAFGFTSLTNVVIPDGVSFLDAWVFYGCEGLEKIVIPDSVTTIGDAAFWNCWSLKDVYYGGTEEQWDAIVFEGSNNDDLINATRHYNSTMPAGSGRIYNRETGASARSVFGGEVSTEETNGVAVKTATFGNLVPGRGYVLLVLVSLDVADILTLENLLFIDQGVAFADGSLTFTYVLPETVVVSYVMACGASDKDLANAEIIFPEMIADSEVQAVNPTVTYQGAVLTEGKDYVIVGKTDYTAAGEYTCFIRGIRNYTGLVECQYTVLPGNDGDVDENGEVNTDDAIYLLYNVMFGDEDYPVNQECDFDGNGTVNTDDAIYLLYHVMFGGEDYPLHN